MAFTQFASVQLVKVLGTSEIMDLGGYKANVNSELKYIRICLNKKGTVPLNTALQLKLHTSSDLTVSYASSNQLYIEDITQSLFDQGDIASLTDDWFSWVRFDFGKENLNMNLTYTISLNGISYTRNADLFYVGVPRDFPFPIYQPPTPPTYPYYNSYGFAKQIFTYQDPL